MKVTVLGKEFVSGTSKKTGREYASTVVHVAFKKNRVEGQAVESVWLDSVSYPPAEIQVGKVYDIDRDNRGFVIGFEAVR